MVWYVTIVVWFWELLKTWLRLFYAPITNPSMLWVLIPIYLNWIFTEIFQEKRGTSMGNATSNAVVVLWAAVDWSRTSINYFKEELINIWNFAGKLFLALVVLSYGGFIVYEGLKGHNLIHYIGRIRVVSYIVIMLTPIVYNSVELSFHVILSILLFFPVFYYLVELIDKFTPDPTPITKDNEAQGDASDFGGNLGGGLGSSSSDLGDDLKL